MMKKINSDPPSLCNLTKGHNPTFPGYEEGRVGLVTMGLGEELVIWPFFQLQAAI